MIAGAVAATEEYGAGAGASRLVTGTLDLHEELEHSLAGFTGFPAALVFSTGYHANLSVVSTLADADTLVVSDAHVHASLIDACRLSRAQVQVVPHNDVAAVGAALTGSPRGGRWSSSRRSTRCSGTPHPLPHSPRCAPREGRSWWPTRPTRSASPAAVGAVCCTQPVSATGPTWWPP